MEKMDKKTEAYMDNRTLIKALIVMFFILPLSIVLSFLLSDYIIAKNNNLKNYNTILGLTLFLVIFVGISFIFVYNMYMHLEKKYIDNYNIR